jgi:4-aminobutyrate aminotransferase-like enzyme
MPDSSSSTSSTSAEQESTPQDYASMRSWRERAEAVLPTGASTGSKRAVVLYGDAGSDAPTHFVRANGCRVTDATGSTFVDCTMALGSVALGYAHNRSPSACSF